MKHRRLVILFLWVLLAVSGNARVFLRWGSASRSSEVIRSAGGKLAYEADITLNSGRGRMTIFGFDRPIREVVTDLRKRFNAPGMTLNSGASMTMGVIRAEGQVIRLVIVCPAPGSRTLVFKLDQNEEEANRSGNPPVNPVAGIPFYPGSETSFYARDDNTRTDFVISLADTAAADVAGFYADRLPSDGWIEQLPYHTGLQHRPRMLVFEKRNALCCIYISTAEPTGKTRTAVIHKEIDMP